VKRIWIAGGVSVLLTACASAPPPAPAARTLKSLDERPTVVLREVAPSDRQLALQSYRIYAGMAETPERRMHAMRRVADLRLLIAEEALAVGGSDQRPAFLAAVEDYRALLREYPAYAAADDVHYQIARAYDNARDDARSLAALTTLIEAYPRSARYLEAQFRRGEILFARGDYAAAERAYNEVVTTTGEATAFHEQALYKRGWARYRQSRLQDALTDFTAVLDRSLVSGSEFRTYLMPESLPRAQRELVDDTLRVISLSFVRLGGPAAASAHFARAGAAPFEPLVYTRLADHYLEQERYGEAAATLSAFIARNPRHEQAPLLQIRIAEIYERARNPARALAARQEFIKAYGRQSDYWEKRDVARMPLVAQRLRQELLGMAQRFHAQAQRSGSSEDYQTAAQWYRDYLGFFPDDDRAPELAFLLGELLFENGRYAEAVEYYEQSAYRYSPHARAAEAGYAALLSYDRHIDSLSDEAERNLWRGKSIDAATRFAGQFPQHPQVNAVLLRTAEHLHATGQHSRALTLAQRVTGAGAQAGPALQRSAWMIVGDVHFARGEYEQAETAYAGAQRIAVVAGERDEALGERLAAAVYKQGEAARSSGDSAAALQHFRRVAVAAPATAIAETADYDAIAVLVASGDWDNAVPALERFQDAWPRSRWQGEVSRQLAVAYLEAGRYAQAAEEFGRVAATNDDPALAREALWQSAELYARAGDMARASLAWQRYITLFPQPVDRAIEARLRIAETFQAAGDGSAQQRWLGEIVSAHDAAGSGGSDFSRQAAAQAALELAAPLRESYARVRLAMPLDRSLRSKRQAMEAALAAYSRAAAYGVAGVTTAATFRIGEIYHDFSRALLDSERPHDLSEDELEEYDVLLEEQAYPFEEEAIKLHEVNYSRITQGVYDDWVRASLEQLGTLVPARYGKKEKRVEYVEAIR
jgi:TolA-binding protein